ncbi:MAG: hypothetical protein IPG07_21920 [Crocinitomicaceae bacterium]|nr:hypothetical protein [Crocinitomicaceae bacterium]
MIPLLDNKIYTKSDLIQQNGHPITTGTDIIKRLITKNTLQKKSILTIKKYSHHHH